MAEGLSVAEANAIAAERFANTEVQLHVGPPGPDGTANVAGNGTRKPVTFAAPAGGAIQNNAAVAWTTAEVDTEERYTHYSIWRRTGGSLPAGFVHSGAAIANLVLAGTEWRVGPGDIRIAFQVSS